MLYFLSRGECHFFAENALQRARKLQHQRRRREALSCNGRWRARQARAGWTRINPASCTRRWKKSGQRLGAWPAVNAAPPSSRARGSGSVSSPSYDSIALPCRVAGTRPTGPRCAGRAPNRSTPMPARAPESPSIRAGKWQRRLRHPGALSASSFSHTCSRCSAVEKSAYGRRAARFILSARSPTRKMREMCVSMTWTASPPPCVAGSFKKAMARV